MAKKLRRRRGRNERLGSAGALSATTWLRFSVGVAIVAMVLLVMLRTRREAIVEAIVPYALYSEIN